ncbi:MAG: hydantoinase/oxoprolinase family protein [Microbacteriaceae bacterium]
MTDERHLRVAIDMGGTFTDLVVDDGSGVLGAFKASTTPQDPAQGILSALMKAAQGRRMSLAELLKRTELLVHGTTRALNAVTTGEVARTAFLTTKGHPDILVYAEGGRSDLFDFSVPARRPYVPRALTVEVDERIGRGGEVVRALDPDEARRVARAVRDLDVEAAAVCLLWSPANPTHEQQLEQALRAELPDLAITLSSRLNPTLREYRRASSAVIDASLKPLMGEYLGHLEERLRDAGFRGRLLIVTSSGGFQDADAVAARPILSVKSGPAMAPVAGRRSAERDFPGATAIIADTGGTTYDVSLVRGGRIPTTRETWIGPRYLGHMTGFSSVDIRSIGAGGGSIAWVDAGGVLHVGPHSAGSTPGPAAYGIGGTEPTLTDACVVLGYLDPQYFLGGSMPLDAALAAAAVARVAEPLGLGVHEAAEAIHRLATERMVAGIEEITLSQGEDPTSAVLVAGGGAGGLNASAIGRRLGCRAVIVPDAAPVMSAYGALTSDLSDEYEIPFPTSSDAFDPRVGAVLAELAERCRRFVEGPGADAVGSRVEFSAEARYPSQVWDLVVPFAYTGRVDADLVDAIAVAFHDAHRRTFAVCDPGSPVEFITWRARVDCLLGERADARVDTAADVPAGERVAYFRGTGAVTVPVVPARTMAPGVRIAGPAIVESEMTTIVVDPGVGAERTPGGDVVLRFEGEEQGR